MVRINLICVGKIKEQYLKDGILEYEKRLSKYCTFNILEVEEEVIYKNDNDINVKEKEGERILKRIKPNDFVITLEIEGEILSSTELEKKIFSFIDKGNSEIDFIIGGSLGLSDNVKKRSNYHLSFSKFTFPHQLMRLIFLEQLYRIFKINKGEIYHK